MKLPPQTVIPTRPGVFAPVTFFDSSDEFAYCREVQGVPNACGIIIAPARSFTTTHARTFELFCHYLRNN